MLVDYISINILSVLIGEDEGSVRSLYYGIIVRKEINMKKTINLILLSIILVFTGCGNDSLDQSNPVIDVEQEVSAKYLLIMDDGFESENTSYAEGDKVKVYYNIIATDTDYSFYTDSKDVELKQNYDENKGYVITFIMPAHDVTVHVDSVNSMVNYPYAFNDVSDDAMAELVGYVQDSIDFVDTLPINICMFDVTEDGYEDVCGTFYAGSENVTSIVAVYDAKEKQGYNMAGRAYEYMIDGIEDGLLMITQTDKEHVEDDVIGTILLSHDWLLFFEDIDMLKHGLSYKTLCMFGYCAKDLLPGNTSSGDYLSSMKYPCVRQMLYHLSYLFSESEMYEQEVDYGPEYGTELIPTTLRRMPYDEWEYLVEEVFMEEDAENLLQNLDESFFGEIAVYYNPDDDCIYFQQGAIGDSVEWKVTDVYNEGSRYVVTYDVLLFSEWLWTAEVTIEESDNIYGYKLISVEIVDQIEDADVYRSI